MTSLLGAEELVQTATSSMSASLGPPALLRQQTSAAVNKAIAEEVVRLDDGRTPRSESLELRVRLTLLRLSKAKALGLIDDREKLRYKARIITGEASAVSEELLALSSEIGEIELPATRECQFCLESYKINQGIECSLSSAAVAALLDSQSDEVSRFAAATGATLETAASMVALNVVAKDPAQREAELDFAITRYVEHAGGSEDEQAAGRGRSSSFESPARAQAPKGATKEGGSRTDAFNTSLTPCFGEVHFTCARCATEHVRSMLERSTPMEFVAGAPAVRCPATDESEDKSCDHGWPLANLAQLIPRVQYDGIIKSREAALTAEARTGALAFARDTKATIDITAIDEEILRTSLRAEGAVYQCRSCGGGPVTHAFCADLMAHHKQSVGNLSRSHINNGCPFCDAPPVATIAEWKIWDGEFHPRYHHSNAAQTSAGRTIGWRCVTASCVAAARTDDDASAMKGRLLPGSSCRRCGRDDPELLEIASRANARRYDEIFTPHAVVVSKCAAEFDALAITRATERCELFDDAGRPQAIFEDIGRGAERISGARLVEALRCVGVDPLHPKVFELLRPLLGFSPAPTGSTGESELDDGTPPVVAVFAYVPPLRDEERAAAHADAVAAASAAEESEIDPWTERLSPGDAVYVSFQGKGKFYPGNIERIHDNGDIRTYDVLCDDGDKDYGVERYFIHGTQTFRVGERIHVDYLGRGKWYAGEVTKRSDDGATYDVRCDDGDEDHGAGADRLRPFPFSGPPSTVGGRLEVGCLVEADSKKKGRWFGARIARVHDNGTYDLRYVDGYHNGDTEDDVLASLIRRPGTLGKKSTSGGSARRDKKTIGEWMQLDPAVESGLLLAPMGVTLRVARINEVTSSGTMSLEIAGYTTQIDVEPGFVNRSVESDDGRGERRRRRRRNRNLVESQLHPPSCGPLLLKCNAVARFLELFAPDPARVELSTEERDQLSALAAFAGAHAVDSDDEGSASMMEQAPGAFMEGDSIEAQFKGRRKWHRGKIEGCNKYDGTYGIRYADGDFESDVDPRFIRHYGEGAALRVPLKKRKAAAKTVATLEIESRLAALELLVQAQHALLVQAGLVQPPKEGGGLDNTDDDEKKKKRRPMQQVTFTEFLALASMAYELMNLSAAQDIAARHDAAIRRGAHEIATAFASEPLVRAFTAAMRQQKAKWLGPGGSLVSLMENFEVEEKDLIAATWVADLFARGKGGNTGKEGGGKGGEEGGDYRAGDQVEARFKGKLRWFRGEIHSCNRDGTYNIRYEDGDRERDVISEFIRARGPKPRGPAREAAEAVPTSAAAAAATATAAHCEGKGSSLLEHHPYGVPHVLGKSVVTALVGVRDAFGSDFLDEATHPMLAPAWLAPDPVNVG